MATTRIKEKTVTFADGTVRDILDSTTVYPSGDPNQRSYMTLHMAESSMTLDSFEALVNTESKTKRMTFHTVLEITDDEGNVTEHETSEVFSNFIHVASVSKEDYTEIDTTTGQAVTVKHLIARLEQLTYIEQKLHELGVL